MEPLIIGIANLPAPARHRLPRAGAAAGTQKGLVLFIALIMLVAMTLSGIALVRSVDTANLISGNLAFKQAALHATDIGVKTAMTASISDPETNITSGGTYRYYATRRKTDAMGVPTTGAYNTNEAATAIDWSGVPAAATEAGNVVKVVIERMCQAGAGTLQERCFVYTPDGGGAPVAYFRATVQVSGPRNTVSMVQVTY